MSKFKAKTRLYKVYHIHTKDNTSYTDGYIGITRRSLAYRLGQHFNSKRPVGKILRELGKENVVIDLIKMCDYEQALSLEYVLRPNRNMGWNSRAGGNAATVRCPSCGKRLPKSKYGSYCMDCRNTKFQKNHVPSNYRSGKHYRITSPEGEVFEPVSLVDFCKQHDLTPQNLRKVAKGEHKHHKGWTAIDITPKIEG